MVASVQFSCSVVSNLLQLYELKLARLPCPSSTPIMSIESVMPSNHLILYFLFLLPSVFPSIMVFSNESVPFKRGPKYWSFNFSISPSSEYSGLIFFRIDWFDLLAIQGTFKRKETPTPQFEIINSSVLSFFYGPALTSIHDYWKNHSLDYMDLCWQSNVSAF